MVFIISNKLDPHCDVIIKKFHERNISFARFNAEDFPEKITIFYEQSKKGQKIVFSSDSFGDISLEQITSVWYRRPEQPNLENVFEDKAVLDLALAEIKSTLSGIWELMRNKLWVNHPVANLVAGQKLNQLAIARNLGIKIPHTIVTNNIKRVLEFFNSHKEIIAKPISAGFVKRGEKISLIYTNKISKEIIFEKINLVKLTPTLFQEYIQKQFELRITVVGNSLFACKIDSQKSEKTQSDWRRYDFDNVPHSPFKLPSEIEKFCYSLLKTLNLSFGAIDMIVTPENDYVFLEINPNGQWGWIEKITGIPISDSIVNLLVNGN